MDVSNASLYGEIDNVVYVRPTKGCTEPDKEHLVWLLHKGLYGLKQAGRIWNKKIDAELRSIGFVPTASDHCVYKKVGEKSTMYLALYVDDCLIFASDLNEMAAVKVELESRFRMKDLGEASYFLGMHVEQDQTNKSI